MLSSPLLPKSQTKSSYLRAATRYHAGKISITVVLVLAFLAMTFVAWNQRSQAIAARQSDLAARLDLLFHGPSDQIEKQIESLAEFAPESVDRLNDWASSINPDSRLRAQLALLTQGQGRFETFAPMIKDAPTEYFDTILYVAERDPQATLTLQKVYDASDSIDEKSRVAILLGYLGDETRLVSLLSGSDDAHIDSRFLEIASQWRGAPKLWESILANQDNTQVRFHCAVLLGSYPKDIWTSSGLSVDLNSLHRDPDASLHGVAKFLAHHLGQPIPNPPTTVPAGANWKVGPEGITMVRLPAGEWEYFEQPHRGGKAKRLVIKSDKWLSSRAISRSLYQEFLDDPAPLLDPEQKKLAMYPDLLQPESLRNDASEPAHGITLVNAVSFCNWLSEREGLTPCYRMKEKATPVPIPGQMPVPSHRFVADWKASGYRLPSITEFAYAAQCGYRDGVPWAHSLPIGIAGNDYEKPDGNPYRRPVYSLVPNRWGVFLHDRMCGSWSATHPIKTLLRIAGTQVEHGFSSKYPSVRHSIFLVQNAEDSTADESDSELNESDKASINTASK